MLDLHRRCRFAPYFLGGSPLQVHRTLFLHWKLAKRHCGMNSARVYSNDGALKMGVWVLVCCESRERMKRMVAARMAENLQETTFHKLNMRERERERDRVKTKFDLWEYQSRNK